MKKSLRLAFLAVAVVAAGVFWWQYHEEDVDSEGTFYGNVDLRQVSLAFDGSGRVVTLHVEEGDQVKAGTVLAQLDTRALFLQAEQVKAQIEVRRQALLLLKNGSRPEEIQQARSRLAVSKAEATRISLELSRLEAVSLNTHGSAVSKQDLDHAKSNLLVAKATVEERREALRLTELGPRAEDIAAAEAELHASEAQLALLDYQINQGTLLAPVDAVVRSRLVEPGDMVTPQKPVFALARMSPKWVRLYVNQRELGRIRQGMAASVVSDTYPEAPVAGKVGYISSVAEFTPKSVQTVDLRTSLVYEVRVVVEDSENRLRLGQPVTINFSLSIAQ